MTDELLVACGQLDLSQDDDFTSKEDPVQEIDWLSDTKIAEWLRNWPKVFFSAYLDGMCHESRGLRTSEHTSMSTSEHLDRQSRHVYRFFSLHRGGKSRTKKTLIVLRHMHVFDRAEWKPVNITSFTFANYQRGFNSQVVATQLSASCQSCPAPHFGRVKRSRCYLRWLSRFLAGFK